MIYIISGASRSGKSILAKQLMQKRGIPYLSLDWLVMGFTNGIPEYGIHDKLWPHEIAEKIWNYLQAMISSIIWTEVDLIIEGEAVLPELLSDFIKKYPKQFSVCFLGYSQVPISQKLKEVYAYHRDKKDWLTDESQEYVQDHIQNMVKYSKRIESACIKYNMKYFDTSVNFQQSLDRALNYLLEEDYGAR